MTNLTLTIDEDVLLRARIRALEQGTSVNAVVRRFLEEYADGDQRRAKAIEGFLEIARRSHARSGPVRWKREDLYE